MPTIYVHLYMDDPGISQVRVFDVMSGGYTTDYYYGDGECVTSVSYKDGEYVFFTATAASGCDFDGWEVHTASLDAPREYHTSNPFEYYGVPLDLYIRPISRQYKWSVEEYSFGEIGAESFGSNSWSIEPNDLVRCSVSFAESGTANFSLYTTCSSGPCGWITSDSSTSINADTGFPNVSGVHRIESNSSSGVSGSYEVEAGVTYYIWLRSYLANDSGTIDLTITPPRNWRLVDDYYFGEISWSMVSAPSYNVTNYWDVSEKSLVRCCVSFAESGTATFTVSTSCSGGITALLTEDGYSGFNVETGMPIISPGYTISPSRTYNVTAGTTYYVWLRPTGENDSGILRVFITPPDNTVEWDLTVGERTSVFTSKSLPTYATAYKCLCAPIVFSTAGTASFCTSGSIDMVCWLSSEDYTSNPNNDWDISSGQPTTYMYYDDNGRGDGLNSQITCDVVANKIYYFYYRGVDGTVSGSTTVEITLTPSWNIISGSYDGTMAGTASSNASLGSYTVYRYGVSFSYGGTVTYAVTGAASSIIYVSTSDGWNNANGAPSGNIIAQGSGSLEQSVSAGSYYYVFVRENNPNTSNVVTLTITAPTNGGGGGTGTTVVPGSLYIYDGDQGKWLRVLYV